MSETEPGPVLHVSNVVKEYQGLRPLRVRDLRVHRGQSVSIIGFDRTAAEVLVNVLIGASLPDAGDVRVFGRSTASIADSDEWLAGLLRFGLFSERTVLIEQLTVAQNLALPHSMDVEPLSDELRLKAQRAAMDVQLRPDLTDALAGGLSALDLAKLRLGRAVALGPEVLLAEHPTATLDPPQREEFARVVARVVRERQMAAVYLTADQAFAKIVGGDVLMLKPATGELGSQSGWRRWLG